MSRIINSDHQDGDIDESYKSLGVCCEGEGTTPLGNNPSKK